MIDKLFFINKILKRCPVSFGLNRIDPMEKFEWVCISYTFSEMDEFMKNEWDIFLFLLLNIKTYIYNKRS